MILKYFIKSIMSNKALWAWGVFFMLFWLAMGAFVFSSNIPDSRASALAYASSWFGWANIISFSSLAITISYTIYFGSSSLSYSFRYTKLRPSTYFLSLLAASSAMGVVMSSILLASTYALFSYRFRINLQPGQPLAAFALAALSGAFMTVLAVALVLAAVNYMGVKNINFISYLPLLLAYAFGFGQLFIKIPAAVQYASPFNDIMSLLFASYSGQRIPVYFSNPAAGFLDWRLMAASLLLWILLLSAVDVRLLRGIKPRALEESRQV